MTIELENKMIGAALYNTDLYKRYRLNPDWIFDKNNKALIRTLEETDADFSDFSDLLMKIQEIEPYTKWSEQSLEMLSFKFHEVSDYGKGVELLERRYMQEKVRVANEKYLNDPTSRNLAYLKDRVRELEDSQKGKDDGNIKAAIEQLLHDIENGAEEGIKSYPQLDKLLGGGMRGGMLVTIGARPSVGKTAYAINLIRQMMEHQPDMQVDLFTLEMSKKQMLDRFISALTGINSYKLRMPNVRLTDDQKTSVVAKALEIEASGLRIYDSLHTVGQIEKQIRRRVFELEGEPYVAVVDYIGLIETDNKRLDRHLQVSEITRTFKKVTNELDVPIIELSQLNRGVESRQDKTPNLSDLRESGSVEQDSNVVGFLHRDPDDETVVKLTIAKNREGFTNTIDYRFHGSSMYFEELDR